MQLLYTDLNLVALMKMNIYIFLKYIIKRLISVLEDLKLKSNTIDLIRFNNIVVD